VSNRTSAGIMSPAVSTMTSPGTISRSGTSRGLPSRSAVAVTRIMARSAAAAASARASCVKRKPTPNTIIRVITVAARRSPVATDTIARIASRMTKGLRSVCSKRTGHPTGPCVAISLGP